MHDSGHVSKMLDAILTMPMPTFSPYPRSTTLSGNTAYDVETAETNAPSIVTCAYLNSSSNFLQCTSCGQLTYTQPANNPVACVEGRNVFLPTLIESNVEEAV